MNNYSNPMVTYDEIVDALRAIIDCSKANGYLEEYGFLNVKYDSLNPNPIQEEQEQVLLQALQSLEKTIEAANKVIRENLEKELAEINAANIFKITSTYEHSFERRKLASQEDLVIKLKEMSLPLEVLNKVELKNDIETVEELPDGFEEIISDEDEFVEDDANVLEEQEDFVTNLDEIIDEMELEDDFQEEFDEEQVEDDSQESADEEQIEDDSQEDVDGEQVEDDSQEENTEEETLVESNKIQLIRKALEKAREKGNEQLVKVLETQLKKEIENLK